MTATSNLPTIKYRCARFVGENLSEEFSVEVSDVDSKVVWQRVCDLIIDYRTVGIFPAPAQPPQSEPRNEVL